MNVSNNFQCKIKHLKCEDIANDIICINDILIVGEKIKYFSYLPIGLIAELERGNKQYFDFGQSQDIFKITKMFLISS